MFSPLSWEPVPSQPGRHQQQGQEPSALLYTHIFHQFRWIWHRFAPSILHRVFIINKNTSLQQKFSVQVRGNNYEGNSMGVLSALRFVFPSLACT